MKKVIVILLSVILSAELFGQQTVDLPPLTKGEYLKKSKRQNTFATVSLSGGLALYFIGTGVAIAQATDDVARGIGGILNPDPPPPRKSDNTAIAALFITGTAAVICSISLYASAAANKRKAKALAISLKPEQTLQFQNYSLTPRLIPSVSLKLNI